MALSAGDKRQLLVTTVAAYERKFFDNITKSNLILKVLRDKGMITSVDGGADIRGPVVFDEELFAWYSADASLSRAKKETISEAIWVPGMAAASVTLTSEELLKNAGRAQIVKLMKGKMTNTERTLKTNIVKGIYGDGTATDSFVGLGAIVSATPAVGTIGGIDAATKAWWRNKLQTVNIAPAGDAVARFRTLRDAMNRLYRTATVGTEKPDIVTLDQDTYGDYENGLQENQRYTTSKAAALGFTSYAFKDASVISEDLDLGHPTNGGYFLNSEFLALEHYPGRNFQAIDLPESTPDKDMVTKHIGFMGALTCYNRARHGRLVVTRT